MITLHNEGCWLVDGQWQKEAPAISVDEARSGTIAYSILQAHNRSTCSKDFRIAFDALASHDITFVGIVQTARASGLKSFPVPYVLTNCHNSLCAVGGTINEDDHVFGLSVAQKYGGNFVPPHVAVIHQYMREMHAGCGKMILGSDSHTRYGALGTLGVGEGGPELVKQLLGKTYDISRPDVVAIWLEGSPKPGVGPMDVSIALVKAVFASGFVKNKILEFMGPGVANLSVDYRIGIDVMTTETTCLSSIWQTDNQVANWLAAHNRGNDYSCLKPASAAYYDGKVTINLSSIEPMIALPFHPSNAVTVNEFVSNPLPHLDAIAKEASTLCNARDKGEALTARLMAKAKDGGFFVDQCIIAGCAGGTHENMVRASSIVQGKSVGQGGVDMSVYPSSLPVYLDMVRQGQAANLLESGATIKTAFCGPCFGAGDVPANGAFSIRHTTRNFPNREGSKPSEGQMSFVALMDARSIAATAINKGRLTPATALPNLPAETAEPYTFDPGIYAKRVFFGAGKPDSAAPIISGPGIADWPAMAAMPENLILAVAASITDAVTTTDELIPSGETSSFRSNPHRLAEFTLSRKDPGYVQRAKDARSLEQARGTALRSGTPLPKEVADLLALAGLDASNTEFGSLVFARKPGDGSAREQAASCQKVLGGWANIACEYATKRYRSNCINWGMLPFVTPADGPVPQVGDLVVLRGIRPALLANSPEIAATLVRGSETIPLSLSLPDLTEGEKAILLAGCLINHYAAVL